MNLRHRIIPCIKHHVSNLVEKSSHFRLRNPVYKKKEQCVHRMEKEWYHEAGILANHIPPADMFATEEDMRDIEHYGWLIHNSTMSMDGNNDNWHEENKVREYIRQLLELFDIIQEARESYHYRRWQ